MELSQAVVLLTSLLSLAMSKNLQKQIIPYFTPKTSRRCTFASICTTTKALGELLKQQSQHMKDHSSAVDSQMKTIETTLTELEDKVKKVNEELTQHVSISIHSSS